MSRATIAGIPEIDAVLNALHKEFSKELVTYGPTVEHSSPIPTGSLALDLALRIGGIPRDRIVELVGWEASGKTSLALHLIRQYQRLIAPETQKLCAFIDLERSCTSELMQSIGVDTSNILFSRPDSAEEALETCIRLGRTGKVGLVVFDSVDAAITEAEVKNSLNDTDVMSLPKLMSRSLRKMSKIASDLECCYLFINQFREKMVIIGNPKTTSGGNALRYYSSLRLELMPHAPSKHTPNAMQMRVKIIKSRFGPPRKDPIEFDFIYATGIDPYDDIINTAKELGLLRHAGQATKLLTSDGNEITISSTGGGAGARAALEQDQVLFETVKKACADRVSGQQDV